MSVWDKVDSVLLRNFHTHEDPLINKYLGHNASTEYEGYLLILPHKKPIWISHPFNYSQAKKVFAKNAQVVTYEKKEDLVTLFKKYAGKRIGFNGARLSYTSTRAFKKLLKRTKLIDVSTELEKEREIKTPQEIRLITKAVRTTTQAIKQIKQTLRVGKTEQQVVREFKNYFEERGLTLAFCIVAFGKNTAHIHYTSGTTKLTNNTPVLIDVGAFFEGYCSDISESFWFGEHKGKQYENYTHALAKVQNAQHAIEKNLIPGTLARTLYTLATTQVGTLPHAIGHGIGLEVHDHPQGIGSKTKWKLQKNMVLALEPAVYTNTFGIRLEKNYILSSKEKKEIV